MSSIDDNDINDSDEISDSKGSGFQLSDEVVSAVIAAELAAEILGATPVGNIDSIDNDINTSTIGIVASAEGQYYTTFEGILADLGYTIDNLGEQDEEALGDPIDKFEEASEENETATIVNNTPVATGGNDTGDDHANGNGGDDEHDPMSGQMSLFDDIDNTDNSNDTDSDDDPMDGQVSFFDDDFSTGDDNSDDGDDGEGSDDNDDSDDSDGGDGGDGGDEVTN